MPSPAFVLIVLRLGCALSHLGHLTPRKPMALVWHGTRIFYSFQNFCAFRDGNHCFDTVLCSLESPGGFVKTQVARPHSPTF